MGYGPAAKAIVLATGCRNAGIECVFVGRGVAYELVARSTGVFEEVVDAAADAPLALALARESRVVVSLMDRDGALLAAESSRPLHVVDSLLWMRDRVPDAFLGARRYWAQRFTDAEAPDQHLVRPTFVGPILGAAPTAPAPGSDLVVNLGGFESDGSPGRDLRYATLLLRAMEASEVPGADRGRIRILASAGTAAALRGAATRLGIETASLAHSEALEALAGANVIVTAPGLTTTLESFQLGRPTFFLPPRNFSQWCALKTLRASGVAPYAMHWEDLDERFRLEDQMPERVRNPQVHAAIDELAARPAAQEALTQLFTIASDGDHSALAADQHAFLSSLGGDGAQTVADGLLAEAGG
jgi:hypothetical protein